MNFQKWVENIANRARAFDHWALLSIPVDYSHMSVTETLFSSGYSVSPEMNHLVFCPRGISPSAYILVAEWGKVLVVSPSHMYTFP